LRQFASPLVKGFLNLRFSVDDEDAAELARQKVVAALDRLEAELGEHDYLVGDTFTVADLSAAALFCPLVGPPEGPRLPPIPSGLEAFQAPLRDRRGFKWVEETFRRHRGPAPDRASAMPASA
jgi:glutathione S-transferase